MVRTWRTVVSLLCLFVSIAAWSQSSNPPDILFHSNWSTTTPYAGGSFRAGSCVAAAGNIYCVGGTDNDQVWFAPLSSSGIGAWQQTTAYGEGGANIFLSCATDNGTIYCVGGGNSGGASGDVTSDLWYAPISSAGIGSWAEDNGLLAAIFEATGKVVTGIWSHSCVTNNGYIYCVGGLIRTYQQVPTGTGTVKVPVDTPTADVFYAPISSSGVGAWHTTSSYGKAIAGHSCVTNNGYIYCVGGITGNGLSGYDVADVWYSQIQSDGSLGAWVQTTSYGGGAVDGLSCSLVSGAIYCVGGNFNQSSGGSSNRIWSAPLSSSGVGGWTAEPVLPTSVWEPSCVSAIGNVYCVGGGSTPGTIATLGSPTGGSTTTYFNSLKTTINLQDASSCSAIGGVWDSSSATCTASSSLSINPQTTVSLQPGVTLNVGSSPCIPTPTTDCTNATALTNYGTLVIPYGSFFNNSGAFTNVGSVLDGGDFSNRGTFTNSGTFLTTGLSANQTGTFSNYGTLTTSGIFVADDSSVVGTVTIILNGNTCGGVDPSSPLYPLVDQDNPFVIYGTWNAGACTIGFSHGNGQFLTVPQGETWQVPAGSTLINHGVLDVFGEIDNAGNLINETVTQNNVIAKNTGFLTIHNLLVNSGTLSNQNGGVLGVAAGATLSNTGTLRDQTNGNIFVAGTLNNSGVVTVDQSGSVYDVGTITNSGTIFNSGTINTRQTVNGTIENTGAGSIVNQNGGTTNGTGGTITSNIGPTVIDLTATSCQALGWTWMPSSNTCVVSQATVSNLDSGTILRVGTGVTLANYGQIGVPGEIDISGTLVNAGYLAVGGIPGTTNVISGSIIVENGAVFNNYSQLLVGAATSLNNAGTVTNATGAVIANQGLLSNSSNIVNSGTIQNDNSQNGATIQNTGTITNVCGGVVQLVVFGVSGNYIGNPAVQGDCVSPSPLEPTIVVLSIAPSPSSLGQAVTLKAVVTPSQATGSVTFFDGSTPLGSSPLSGTGQSVLVTGGIAAGTRSITAKYNGDGSYAPSTSAAVLQTVSSTPNQPMSVAAADLDNDGKIDLAVAENGSNTVSILRGIGDGTFQQIGSYAVGAAPCFVSVGDFNNDGHADLAVANCSPTSLGSVSVLLGNGDGTFQSAVNYQAGVWNSSLAIADLKGNGKLDLIIGNEVQNTVNVLFGNGDGTFQAAVTIPAAQSPKAVAVGDFNHDGIPDLAVVSNVQGTVSVLIGRGDGTFLPIVNYNLGVGMDPTAVAVGDFNGDGKLDLVVANFASYPTGSTTSSVSVLLGNGDGTFQPPNTYSAGNGPISVALADVNGDGIPDVVLANLPGSTVSILLGKGNGTFQPEIALPVGTNPYSVAIGDFNGDGWPDFVTANQGSNDMTVQLGPLAGGLASPSLVVTGGQFTYDNTAHPAICTATGAGGATISGNCTLTYNGIAAAPTNVGTYSVNANFVSSDRQYGNATGTATITINQATPTVLISGGPFTYGATHAPTCKATGVAGTSVPGSCSLTYNGSSTAPWNAGAYNADAIFTSADSNYANATASVTLTVSKANLTVSASNAAVSYGASLPTLTATITGFVNGDTLATAVTGMPSLTTTATSSSTPGTYPITVTQGTLAAANYTFSFAPGTMTVTQATPTLGWSSPAAITYGTALSATQLNATASVPGSFSYTPVAGTVLGTGTHTLSVIFAPNDTTNYTAVSQTVPLTVNRAALTVTANDAAMSYGASLPSLTGTITGVVNGDGITASYSTVATSTSVPGNYPITVTLNDPNNKLPDYALTSSNGTLTINKAASGAALQTSAPIVLLETNLTLTAKVSSTTSGMPTGTVTFMDGTTPLGSANLDNTGTGTLTLSTLSAGTHSLTVVYGGDSDFTGVISAALSETVQDFQLGGGPGSVLSVTVLPGGIASYRLQVSPTNGTTFPSAITLSLSGLPAGATYTITPAMIATGSGAQTVTVNVQTAKPVARLRKSPLRAPLFALALLVPIFGMVRLYRSQGRTKEVALLVLLLLVLGTLGMSACGGNGNSGSNSAPQTYILQLNATSGALGHSATLTLRVE